MHCNIFSFAQCDFKKGLDSKNEQKDIFTGPYYVVFSFDLPNTHLLSMGGVGNDFDTINLKKNNINDFVESFYTQMVYTPFIITEYGNKMDLLCLGYKISWHDKYPQTPYYSAVLERYGFELEDGTWINIRAHRLLDFVKVEYVKDFKHCISPSSMELDIDKIKSIDKAAILIDGY